MIKIGITGGIGSGKSTVCRAFAQLGVPVYDSDSRARRLMNEDVALKAAVSGLFGDGAYDADGLNRKYVAGRIFSDGTLRERLNAVVHPAVAALAAGKSIHNLLRRFRFALRFSRFVGGSAVRLCRRLADSFRQRFVDSAFRRVEIKMHRNHGYPRPCRGKHRAA